MGQVLQPSISGGKLLSFEYGMQVIDFGILHTRINNGITIAVLYPQDLYLRLRAWWPPQRALVRLGVGNVSALMEVQVPLTEARYRKLAGEAANEYAMPQLGTETLLVPGRFVPNNAACVRLAIEQRAPCRVAVLVSGGTPKGALTQVYAYEQVAAYCF